MHTNVHDWCGEMLMLQYCQHTHCAELASFMGLLDAKFRAAINTQLSYAPCWIPPARKKCTPERDFLAE